MKVLRNSLFAIGSLALLIAALVALSPRSQPPSATHPDPSGTKAEAAASSSLASAPSSLDARGDALSDDPRTKEAAVAFLLPGPPPAAEVRDAALATLLPGPAPDALIDDPRTKEAALVTFLLPGPPPAAEVRNERPGGEASTDPKLAVRAPGEVNGAEIAELLAARPRSTPPSTSATIELPFTDADGKPYTQERPPGRRTVAKLPFDDSNGKQIEVPLPERAI